MKQLFKSINIPKDYKLKEIALLNGKRKILLHLLKVKTKKKILKRLKK